MATLIVRGDQLLLGDKSYRCAIGKSGLTDNKREGDNCTPIGTFTLRECWFRADKLLAIPQTELPLNLIVPNDGWCDAPEHKLYNMHVKLPFDASHEKLWREDGCYDLMVPLGYNDELVTPGLGSAIFLHVAKPGYSGTEGCVAVALEDLLEIVAQASQNSTITIENP